MKKLVTVFDTQPGNASLMQAVLAMLIKPLDSDDKIVLFSDQNTRKIYQSDGYKNVISRHPHKPSLFITDKNKSFGDNLRDLMQQNKDKQLFIFKTTLPIQYYDDVFQLQLGKSNTYLDDWFLLPNHDVVSVPNRNGKIFKVGQDRYLSIKQEQYVNAIPRNIEGYEPDFFIFGRQFLSVLLTVNDFRQNNFAYIIHQAAMLKKPVQLKGRRTVKKFWNFVPNLNKYAVIPQYVQPIVKQVKDGKMLFRKLPTVVGNKYFKNSQWVGQVLSRINECKFLTDTGVTMQGLSATDKIAVKYDMDVNGAVYVAKFIKQIASVNPNLKVDFYTKNSAVKQLFRQLVQKDITNRITWIDNVPYNVICNVLDYYPTGCAFKFDLNYFQFDRNRDLNVAISQTLSMPKPITRRDTVFQSVPAQVQDTLTVCVPSSPQISTTAGYLHNSQMFGKFDKLFVIIEPVNVNAANAQQLDVKMNKKMTECEQIIKKSFPDKKIQFMRSLFVDQKSMIKAYSDIAKKYKNFYFATKNFLYTLATNYRRQVTTR